MPKNLQNIELSKINRCKAIRLKCIDCSGGVLAEVRKCPVKDCPLYKFRMGYSKDKD